MIAASEEALGMDAWEVTLEDRRTKWVRADSVVERPDGCLAFSREGESKIVALFAPGAWRYYVRDTAGLERILQWSATRRQALRAQLDGYDQ